MYKLLIKFRRNSPIVFYTNSLKRLIGDNNEFEWAHFNWDQPIPPTNKGSGSFNHFIPQLLKIRYPKDILICKYYKESYEKCQILGIPAIMIKMPESFTENKKKYILFRILKKLLIRSIFSTHIKIAVKEITKLKINKILIWDNILGGMHQFRKLLPNNFLAYAQRHYDYPNQNRLLYEFLDVLLTQTRGQAKLAFNLMSQISPLILTIPNGVELDKFDQVSDEEKLQNKLKLGIPADRFVVLFPSKLAAYKGTQYLIRWISYFKNNSKIHFLIPSQLHHNLNNFHRHQLINILNNSDNVTWLGGVERDQMVDCYKASDAAIMTAMWREGFSMSAIESMASGIPIVAINEGFYSEIIVNYRNGILCRVEYLYEDGIDAIQQLADSQDLCTQIGKYSREFCEKRLSREKMLKNFCAFLEGKYEEINDNLQPI